MKERPILLGGTMPQSIIENRKTQTRRLIDEKTQVFLNTFFGDGDAKEDDQSEYSQRIESDGVRVWLTEYPEEGSDVIKCPYGLPGDNLWVRETYAISSIVTSDNCIQEILVYKSSGQFMSKWTPSIHMPRWSSRLTIKIMDIRIERLQEISEKDAISSGVATGRWGYRKQWEEFYGPVNWLRNPWVWVIEFRRI